MTGRKVISGDEGENVRDGIWSAGCEINHLNWKEKSRLIAQDLGEGVVP